MRWNRNYEILRAEKPKSVFFVDWERNFVGRFNDSFPEGNRMRHVSGVPMVAGYRDGAMVSALFNRPMSIVGIAFGGNRTQLRAELEATKQAFVFKNSGCLQAWRGDGRLLAECLTEAKLATDLSLLAFIYDEGLVKAAVKESALEELIRVLIVSDTGNHCIRLIDLKDRVVRTLVGQCGQPGFMDGMRRNSLLNSPKSIGIDRAGRFYIHDDGNSSVRRLLLPDEFTSLEKFISEAKLVTLVNGTCYSLPDSYQYTHQRQLSGDARPAKL